MTPSRIHRPILVLTVLVTALAVSAGTADAKRATVKVMSRNLYLGADLTPGVKAGSLQELVDAAGHILNTVDQNDFGTRAKGVAAEILKQQPDLVGLQEASLWRTEPCDQVPIPPKATTVRWDYVKLLLAALNKGKTRYRLVVAKPQFDFEVYANTDGNEQTAGPNCPFGSEINARLTMRDAILARIGRVRTSHVKSGTFKTLLRTKPANVNVDVNRGWTAVDAKVAGKKFRFVNTHLEAFDSNESNTTNHGTQVGRGEIRQAQAEQLVKKGGPASGKLPVILVGDLNSDVKTKVQTGDDLAYRAVLKAKFVERSALKPFGCCLNADLITANGGGKTSDFDHKVDHILTNSPKRVKLVKSVVTGRSPVSGFWDSDHAGLFSSLKLN